MVSRSSFGSVLALLLGAATPFLYSRLREVTHAQSGPSIVNLRPLYSFEVPADADMRLVASAASNTELWFLLHGPNGIRAVTTDGTGRLQGSAELGSFSMHQFFGMCPSEDGRLAIVKGGGSIDVYSKSSLIETGVADHAVGCVFLHQGSELFSVAPDRVSRVYGSSGNGLRAPRKPLAWPTLELSLSDDRIGVIETASATLNVVDTLRHGWDTSALEAPEIQGVSRDGPSEKGVSPSIFAASVDRPSGHIFAAVSPFNVDEGAIILEFTDRGVLLSRLRCELPRFPNIRTPRNKDGHFTLNNIAVASGKLFLISNPQRTCLSYNLPAA